jgi:hypothetical protein
MMVGTLLPWTGFLSDFDEEVVVIGGMIGGMIGGTAGWLAWPLAASGQVAEPGLPAAGDATKNPQPLSLYVFLFMSAALALLLLSMVSHMKRARRNLGQTGAPGTQAAAAPPQEPPAGPTEVG